MVQEIFYRRVNILYVGDLWEGSTAGHRMNALSKIGTCDAVDSTIRPRAAWLKYLHLASIKLKWHWDLRGINRAILDKSNARAYDVLWIDKGLHIYPDTLKKIKSKNPNCFIISFSPDDMFNPANQSWWYVRGIGLYDLHVTTKSYNVEELKSMGARNVFFIDKAFAPEVHRKMVLTLDEKSELSCDVGFIGSWEKDRDEYIQYLAGQGINVTVTGSPWIKMSARHPGIKVIPAEFWGEAYAKVINATKINLCFLKKGNRDLQTARSIEIPACGGFMLAERTKEHQRLFTEDREAVFFSTKEELLQKVKYYLANDMAREEIAERGYDRCRHSGYDNFSRLSQVFAYIKSIPV